MDIINFEAIGLYIFWLILIAFLTRPNVKKQFR
jgi:hypothetical protein